MHEATIILPMYYNNHERIAGHTFDTILASLVDLWGGVTHHTASGMFRNAARRVQHETVMVINIAFSDTPINRSVIRGIARNFAVDHDQESVYVRWPDGQVQFITRNSELV